MRFTNRNTGFRSQRGVALILVMLAIFVLSVLAASIIFSARAETFASYNYRLATEADYVAKAGLEKALNFLNSRNYAAVSAANATTEYQMATYATVPLTLVASPTMAVQCIATDCNTANADVTLSVDSSGSFNGNYPSSVTNPGGTMVRTAYKNFLYNVALNPLSSSSNSGEFTVTAKLIKYYTVNNAFYGLTPNNIEPYEVWQVSSTGTWNSNVGAGVANPTSVQQGVIAPIYLPYFGNALYGMCSISLNGTVCTDSYNSSSGTYSGSQPKNCVNSGNASSNALASGAGVGAGGGATLAGSSYTVNGNLSYGSSSPTYSGDWACPSSTSGVTGSVSGILGSVQVVPAIPQPPIPTFPNCSLFGVSTPTCAAGTATAGVFPYTQPSGSTDYAWIRKISGAWKYELNNGLNFDTTIIGSGTQADPFILPDMSSMGSHANLCIAGGDTASSALYYAMGGSLNEGNNGNIYVVKGSDPSSGGTSSTLLNSCPPSSSYADYGFAVVDIYNTLSLAGNGIISQSAPPESLALYVYNGGSNTGTSVKINGNANVSALITALGNATLGGGGSGGAMYGSILAGSITDGGTYAVHYDLSLQVASGSLTGSALRNYNRPKL